MSSILDKVKASVKNSTETELARDVEFKHGIFVRLRHIKKAEFRSLVDEATSLKYNTQTKQREPVTDSTRLSREFVLRAVKGWKGMTPKTLSKLVPIDLTQYTEEELKEEIPFSVDLLQDISTNSLDLDSFVQEMAMNIDTFQPGREGETKN